MTPADMTCLSCHWRADDRPWCTLREVTASMQADQCDVFRYEPGTDEAESQEHAK